MTDIVTYCDVNTCDDCQRYGDDCDGDKRVEHTDLISREDVIGEISKGVWNEHELIDRIKSLPSAELTLQTPQTYGKSINPSNAEVVEDLISRADAIELAVDVETPEGTYESAIYVDDLMALPSAESEWIPCSERLPKAEDMYQPPEQRYLCQLEAHGVRKFCVLSRLKGAVSPFWDWYGIAVYDSEVIAWMPLPKPYREEGEV